MVLAAGLGTRLRPLTDDRPKPLVEVAGRTLIDRLLDQVAEAGIGLAVVNLHHFADRLEAHLRTRRAPRLVFSDERERLLETGGGTVKALSYLGGAPFFVVNADVILRHGPTGAFRRLAERWDAARMDALLLMMPTSGAIGYEGPGDYFLAADGRARHGKPGEVSPFLYAGLMILKPAALAGRAAEPFGLRTIFDALEAKGRLYGLRHDGGWIHVGTPEGVAEAERALGEV
ncbi:MAG: nucleotidyltransferase family protein [Alphaproteobacteria bacterium]|nr:nucleotidyltransferase family protein [Alphaproteobacteria bacterium]